MKYYYLFNFIVANKTAVDGKKDLKQGLLIQPSTYPAVIITNVNKRPTIDIATDAFNKGFLNREIRSTNYLAIPCNNGEKITAKEAEWWLARTPNLVLNVVQKDSTAKKKPAKK